MMLPNQTTFNNAGNLHETSIKGSNHTGNTGELLVMTTSGHERFDVSSMAVATGSEPDQLSCAMQQLLSNCRPSSGKTYQVQSMGMNHDNNKIESTTTNTLITPIQISLSNCKKEDFQHLHALQQQYYPDLNNCHSDLSVLDEKHKYSIVEQQPQQQQQQYQHSIDNHQHSFNNQIIKGTNGHSLFNDTRLLEDTTLASQTSTTTASNTSFSDINTTNTMGQSDICAASFLGSAKYSGNFTFSEDHSIFRPPSNLSDPSDMTNGQSLDRAQFSKEDQFNAAWPDNYSPSRILESVVNSAKNDELCENQVEADSSYDSDHEEMNKLVDHLVDSGTSNSPQDENGYGFIDAFSSAGKAKELNNNERINQVLEYHCEVNRTTSETLGQEFTECITKEMFTNRSADELPKCEMTGKSVMWDTKVEPVKQNESERKFKEEDLNDPFVKKEYTSKLKWIVKLGYTEDQFRRVIACTGLKIRLNDILGLVIIQNSDLTSEEFDDPLIDDFHEIEHDSENSSSEYSSCSTLTLQPKATKQPATEANITSADRNPLEKSPRDQLRPIVIDGSNVAMSHGNKEYFSCRGIQICVDWFRKRGHQDIIVFVPMWRKQERSEFDHPIRDKQILLQLEAENVLRFTPSRTINGQTVVSHDDLYILQLALFNQGVIVSNDNYRDIIKEHPEYKRMIDERLLMFTFVNDIFMPPFDPLGRRAPKLDKFLTFSSNSLYSQRCPYEKRCTYGNKCKYYHPERNSQTQKSVVEMLQQKAKENLEAIQGNEVTRPLRLQKSLPLTGSLSTVSNNSKSTIDKTKLDLCRTKSNYLESTYCSKKMSEIKLNSFESTVQTTSSFGAASTLIQEPVQTSHRKLERQLTLNSEFDPRLQALTRSFQANTEPRSNPLIAVPNNQTLLAVPQTLLGNSAKNSGGPNQMKLCQSKSCGSNSSNGSNNSFENGLRQTLPVEQNQANQIQQQQQPKSIPDSKSKANILMTARRQLSKQKPIFKSLSSSMAIQPDPMVKLTEASLTRNANSLHAPSRKHSNATLTKPLLPNHPYKNTGFVHPQTLLFVPPVLLNAPPLLANFLQQQSQQMHQQQKHQQQKTLYNLSAGKQPGLVQPPIIKMNPAKSGNNRKTNWNNNKMPHQIHGQQMQHNGLYRTSSSRQDTPLLSVGQSNRLNVSSAHQHVTRNLSAPETTISSRQAMQQHQQNIFTTAALGRNAINNANKARDNHNVHQGVPSQYTAGRLTPPLVPQSKNFFSLPQVPAPPLVNNNQSEKFKDERNKIFFHLSSLFSHTLVFKAMNELPDELNSSKICELILNEEERQNQFQ